MLTSEHKRSYSVKSPSTMRQALTLRAGDRGRTGDVQPGKPSVNFERELAAVAEHLPAPK